MVWSTFYDNLNDTSGLWPERVFDGLAHSWKVMVILGMGQKKRKQCNSRMPSLASSQILSDFPVVVCGAHWSRTLKTLAVTSTASFILRDSKVVKIKRRGVTSTKPHFAPTTLDVGFTSKTTSSFSVTPSSYLTPKASITNDTLKNSTKLYPK